MSMTDLEAHVLAYYVAGEAKNLAAAPRFYPHGELILIVEDKIGVATRKFGSKVRGKANAAATVFVDHMIAAGAWSTKNNDFGGTMHQYQPEGYRAALADWQASDPIVAAARASGETFWADTFAALTA